MISSRKKLELFIEFLKTGKSGVISPDLLLYQVDQLLGPPEGQNVYKNFLSPVDNTMVVLTNLYYPGLFLGFLDQRLFQFNVELQHYIKIQTLPKSAHLTWYSLVRSMSIEELSMIIENYEIPVKEITNDSFDENEKVLLIKTSRLSIFMSAFYAPPIYKISYINYSVN